MAEQQFYEYLVIGGDRHGTVYSGPKTRVLEIPSKYQPMLKFYARGQSSDTLVPVLDPHLVIEHIREDGKHFYIASNDEISKWDIDSEIARHKLAPIN